VRLIVKILFFSCVTILLLINGLYYQTQSDTVFPTYIFGCFNGGTNALPTSFGCFSFIGYLMNYLSNFIKPEFIYDGFQLALVLMSIIIISIIFINRIRLNSSISILLLTTFFILLIDFCSPFEFSKTSFILSFCSFLLPKIKRNIFIQITFFSLAFLIRPEPVAIVACIFLIYELTNINIREPIKHIRTLIKNNLIFVLAFTLLSLLINISYTEEDEAYKKIRPFEYSLSDFNRNLPSHIELDKIDSIKIKAAMNFFYADKEELNFDYFEKRKIDKRDKTPISIFRSLVNFGANFKFDNQFKSIVKELTFYWIFCLIWLSFLLLNKNIRLFLFVLTSVLFLILIAIFFKPELHFITPHFSVVFILSIIEFNHQREEKNDFLISRIVFGITFTLSLMQIFLFQQKQIDKSKIKHNYFEKIIMDIEAVDDGLMIIMDVGVWDEFHYKLFSKIQPLNYRNIVVVDGGILYLNKEYQNKMKSLTEKEYFIDQYSYLFDSEKLLVYTSDKRLKLISDYVKIIYNKEFYLKRFKEFKSGKIESSGFNNTILLSNKTD
jgi:hypothetical protein